MRIGELNRLMYFIRHITAILILLLITSGNAAAQEFLHPTLQFAFTQAQAHDYPKAVSTMTAFADNAFTSETALLLADYFYYARQVHDGLDFFSNKYANQSENPVFYLGLARLTQQQKDWRETLNWCVKGLASGATHPELVALLVKAGLELKQTSQLARVLGNLQKKPEQKYLYNLGYAIWRNTANNQQKAEQSILNYLSAQPTDPYGLLVAGDIFKKADNLTESDAYYRKALTHLPVNSQRLRSIIHTHLANNAFAAENIAAARNFLNEAFDSADQIGAIHHMLKVAESALPWYMDVGLFGEIDTICNLGIKLTSILQDDTRMMDWRLQSGKAKRHLNHRDKALEQFHLILDSSSASNLQRIQSSREVAAIHMEQSQHAQALQFLEMSIAYARRAKNTAEEYQSLFQLAEIQRILRKDQPARQNYDTVLRYAQDVQNYQLTDACWTRLSQLSYPQENQDYNDYFLRMADALARQTSQLQFSANLHWLQGRAAALNEEIEKAETYFLSAIEVGQQSGAYFAVLAGQAGLTSLYLQSGFVDLSSQQANAALETLVKTYELTRNDHNTTLFDVNTELFEPAIHAFSEVGDLPNMFRTCELKKAFQLYRDIRTTRQQLKIEVIDSLNLQFAQTQWQIQSRWQQLRRQWQQDKRDHLEQLIETKQKISQLEDSRWQILQEIARNRPQYLDFFMPNTIPLAQLQHILGELEATYVDYFLGENSTFIFVVTPDNIHCKRVNLSRAYLTSIVKQIAPALTAEGAQTTAPSLEFNINLCGELYNYLIAPVRNWLEDGRTIVFSGDGVLNTVPFECLVVNPMELTDDFDYRHARYLIEVFPVTYVPHANFLRKYTKMQARNTEGLMLSMAVLATETGKNKSPESDQDLKAHLDNIQNAIGGEFSKTYIGNQATETVFLAESSKYQLLHLMLPTRFDALSPTNLRLSFGDSDSEVSYPTLFYQTKLNTELMVFEACNTSMDAPTDIMRVSGMLHGLNFAGVENLVTNITKNEGNEQLLVDFLSNLEIGTDAAKAMQKAKQIRLQTDNRNPYSWNAMLIYGPPVEILLKPKSNWRLLSVTIAALLLLIGLIFLKTRQLNQEKG